MRLMLDTHTLLWFLSSDPKLSATAKLAIENLANIRYLSPASLVEIALKVRLGKLKLNAPFASLFPIQLIANDIHLIHLEPERIEPLTTLPLHHKDPFDRLIAATALVEGLTLVSKDQAFDAYGLSRLW
jgi:PIN domain nuclease of toxin-antitoxin system